MGTRSMKTIIDRQRERMGICLGLAIATCCFLFGQNSSSAAGCDEVRLFFTKPVRGLSGAFDVATADFNGDGYLDFAVADPTDAAVVFLGAATGRHFMPGARSPAGGFPIDLAVGDFDHDGYPDLAIASGGSFEPHV